MNILFICLGNICRSPAAEGIFKHLIKQHGIEDQFLIDSAGTYGGHSGELPDLRMRNAAKKRGYELNSRSRKLRTEDFEKFDLLLVMDDSVLEDVKKICPDADSKQKIERMATFCTIPNISYIPDPYYEGAEGFEHVLNLLENACQGLLQKLKS